MTRRDGDAAAAWYVPELPVYGDPITLNDLMHHTSGLRDIYFLRSLMGLTEKDYFSEVDFLDDVGRQLESLGQPLGCDTALVQRRRVQLDVEPRQIAALARNDEDVAV